MGSAHTLTAFQLIRVECQRMREFLVPLLDEGPLLKFEIGKGGASFRLRTGGRFHGGSGRWCLFESHLQ